MNNRLNAARIARSSTRRSRQSGAVLAVSLVILVVVTVLTVGTLRSSSLEEKMAAATRDRNVAFQSTESAVREGELYIESITSLGEFTGNNGLFGQTDAAPGFLDSATWSDSSNHVVADSDFGSYQAPRYYIKADTVVTGTEGALNMSGYGDNKGTGDVTVFSVTARGTGAGADSAEVILRSRYGRAF